MSEYNLLYFIYGASIMFHLIAAWLFIYAKRSRLRQLVSALMLITVAQYVKDLCFIGSNYYNSRVEESIASIIDLMSIPFYACVLVEACRPLWLNWWRGFLFCLPFVVSILGYVFFPIRPFFYAIHTMAAVYCVAFVVWTLHELPLFHRYLREEYSYDENINLHWLRGVLALFFLVFVFWSYDNFNPGVKGDIVFLLGSLITWMITCFFFYRQALVFLKVDKGHDNETIVVPADYVELNPIQPTPDKPSTPPTSEANVPPIVSLDSYLEGAPSEADDAAYALAMRIHRLFEEECVFLDPHLRLSELAVRLGTNRTYLSQFFNKSCEQTFYDCVNKYRIDYAKHLLLTTDYTLETVATQSGFNSLSTFRRAFQMNEGYSPQTYRSVKK